MARIKPKSKKQNKTLVSPFKNYWGKNNYIIFGFGIGLTLLGFILMSQSPWDNPLSLTLSPIVLLFAYLIVFPFSILYRKKRDSSINNVSSEN